jgi:hypothetical protein
VGKSLLNYTPTFVHEVHLPGFEFISVLDTDARRVNGIRLGGVQKATRPRFGSMIDNSPKRI